MYIKKHFIDILTVRVSTCIKIPRPGKEYLFHGYLKKSLKACYLG